MSPLAISLFLTHKDPVTRLLSPSQTLSNSPRAEQVVRAVFPTYASSVRLARQHTLDKIDPVIAEKSDRIQSLIRITAETTHLKKASWLDDGAATAPAARAAVDADALAQAATLAKVAVPDKLLLAGARARARVLCVCVCVFVYKPCMGVPTNPQSCALLPVPEYAFLVEEDIEVVSKRIRRLVDSYRERALGFPDDIDASSMASDGPEPIGSTSRVPPPSLLFEFASFLSSTLPSPVSLSLPPPKKTFIPAISTAAPLGATPLAAPLPIGLEEGRDVNTADYLSPFKLFSMLLLRHIRTRDFRRKILALLNYFRSIERTLAIEVCVCVCVCLCSLVLACVVSFVFYTAFSHRAPTLNRRREPCLGGSTRRRSRPTTVRPHRRRRHPRPARAPRFRETHRRASFRTRHRPPPTAWTRLTTTTMSTR